MERARRTPQARPKELPGDPNDLLGHPWEQPGHHTDGSSRILRVSLSSKRSSGRSRDLRDASYGSPGSSGLSRRVLGVLVGALGSSDRPRGVLWMTLDWSWDLRDASCDSPRSLGDSPEGCWGCLCEPQGSSERSRGVLGITLKLP